MPKRRSGIINKTERLISVLSNCSKRISPADPMLQYMGRIDFSNPDAPVFAYPCTNVKIRFRGTAIHLDLTNLHSYYENAVGVILDGVQRKIVLSDSRREQIPIGEDLPDEVHELMVFKRMDACHHFVFHGFLLPEDAQVLPLPEKPRRRMEFYGDSVTAGEVCELEDYCGKADPPHNGQYSNSFYSYAWITARRLNAQIHDVAQGGIALLKGTGYYCAPERIGMEQMYDKIQSNPNIEPPKPWNFAEYTPHVVVVAIGQNDNHPADFMEQGIENEKALHWRARYLAFIRRLRGLYPNATIILSTTILNHCQNWDLAIDAVWRELADPKIHHFLYSNNGCGTPGHIRASEAENMARELSTFIESLGEEIWEDTV